MENFINNKQINTLLEDAKSVSSEDIRAIIAKAKTCVGLSLEEVAALLQFDDDSLLEELYDCANHIKKILSMVIE